MTNSIDTIDRDVIGPSRKSRPTSTFRLQLLMEEARRLEIGGRIRELREAAPFGQQHIADKLGIQLRAYQKVEKNGTTQFERCQELYEIHREWIEERGGWEFVTAAWIWDGRETQGPTPDPFAVVNQAEPDEAPGDLAELDRRAKARHLVVMAELGEIRRLVEDQGTPGQQDGRKAAGE